MKLRLSLVKSGVPFDVAFSLSEAEALGWYVAGGESDGGRFDWTNMRWHKDRT